mgnify:CR=1 FL=1
MTIAITGATGQLGRLVVKNLLAKVPAEQIVALVRSPQKAIELGVAAREADYAKPHTLTSALAGVDTLLLISSSEIGQRAVATGARVAGSPSIPTHSGCGSSTGACAGRHLGSCLRFDYEVPGDCGKLASRLEGQCKAYGLPIIIGSKTANAAKDKFALLELWDSPEALADHAKLQAARPPLPEGLRAGAGAREDYTYNRTR